MTSRRVKITGAMLFELVVLAFLFLLIFSSAGLPERSKRLPLLIGWVTVGITAADILLGIHRQLRPRADGGEKKERKKLAPKEIGKVVGSVLFLLATILLWRLAGFVLTSLVVTITYAIYLGSRSRIGLIAASLLLSAGVYYLFGVLLGVPLPRGLLIPWLF